jgi:hypothetical protein
MARPSSAAGSPVASAPTVRRSTVRRRRPDGFPTDVLAGAVSACALAVLAAIPLLGGALLSLLGLLGRGSPGPGAFLRGWMVVAGTYLAAGVAGGICFWALRPLRRWTVGWGLTGAVVAVLAFGGAGLAMWYAPEVFDQIGRRPRRPEATAEFLRKVVPLLALGGFGFGVWERISGPPRR